MKNDPRAEDRGLLRFHGIMGHEYVGVEGEVGKRRVYGEFNSLTSAEDSGKGAVNPEVYTKIRGVWSPVASI